uniref:RF_PROK_I domain-containing protein n=1 Tax=Mesocestoides corti TaxID=53468 RepID=A0A5K3F7D2_MESCO
QFAVDRSPSNFEKSIHEKNVSLEKNVLLFDIASQEIKKSILPEGFDYVPKSKRKLPQRFELGSPIPPPHIEFGFAIPECIPKGRITMKQAVDLIKNYQTKSKTISQLAFDHELDVSMVSAVCKYFSLFERDAVNVWVPPLTSTEKKELLDTPVYQEDDQLAGDGVARLTKLRELSPPSK